MKLTTDEIYTFEHSIDDTHLHMKACEMADMECFRLYGTDSIHDPIILWPRWQEFYQSVIDQVYKPRNAASSGIGKTNPDFSLL